VTAALFESSEQYEAEQAVSPFSASREQPITEELYAKRMPAAPRSIFAHHQRRKPVREQQANLTTRLRLRHTSVFLTTASASEYTVFDSGVDAVS
jgi:hypothetical protein